MTCDRIEELLTSLRRRGAVPKTGPSSKPIFGRAPGAPRSSPFFKSAAAALAAFPEIEPGAELRRKLYAIPGGKRNSALSLDLLLKPSLQPVFAAASLDPDPLFLLYVQPRQEAHRQGHQPHLPPRLQPVRKTHCPGRDVDRHPGRLRRQRSRLAREDQSLEAKRDESIDAISGENT